MITPKKRAFVQSYLTHGFNATRAAIDAGYSIKTAGSQGQRLLNDVDVKALIAEAQQRVAARSDMTVDELVDGLTKIVRADVRKVMRWFSHLISETEIDEDADGDRVRRQVTTVNTHGYVISSDEIDDDIAFAIQEVRFDANGRPILKLAPKLEAMKMLALHLGMISPSGPGRAATSDPNELDDDELADIARGSGSKLIDATARPVQPDRVR